MGQHFLRLQNTLYTGSRVFVIPRAAAQHSAVIRMILEDFDEAQLAQHTVPLAVDVSDDCLAKVFEWVTRFQGLPVVTDGEIDARDARDRTEPDRNRKEDRWDGDFFGALGPDMILEILLAANYLDIWRLYNEACLAVSDMLHGRSTEEMRDVLGLENDFTPEEEDEEEAVRREIAWAYDKFGCLVVRPGWYEYC